MKTWNNIFLTLMGFIAIVQISGCANPDQSFFIYRLPYQNGTEVDIWQDHTTHSNGLKRLDMAGVNGTQPYKVVAAREGTIRRIVDSNTLNCCGGSCDNNYVWIQHPGDEWTKYSHLTTDSVTGNSTTDAGLSEGDSVDTGQLIGLESDVGRACGDPSPVHLHFEILVPTDEENPVFDNQSTGQIVGDNKIPRFCGVPGQIAEKDMIYTASACP